MVLWTSLIILIYPGVKIAAAGLYTATTTDFLFATGSVAVDSSLADNLERAFELGRAATAGITDRASQWSEWSQIISFQLPPRMDTLDNLVFSTVDVELANAASVRAVIPAVEVQVNCTTHDTDAFTPWVTAENQEWWGYTVNWLFHAQAKDLNETGVSMINYYQTVM